MLWCEMPCLFPFRLLADFLDQLCIFFLLSLEHLHVTFQVLLHFRHCRLFHLAPLGHTGILIGSLLGY